MRDMVKPALSLFVICFITTFCLAFVNAVTKDAIAARAEEDAKEKRRLVMREADDFRKLEGWSELDGSGLVGEVYEAYDGNMFAGYVFNATPSGYGGEISVTVGIGADNKITGVKVGDNAETPGLGTKTAEDAFTGQFAGKDSGTDFIVVKRPASGDDEIQAVSGATISSNAVTRAVRASAELGRKLLEKRNGGGAK